MDLEPQQIYRIHENEKKCLYSRRVLDIEHGTFTTLVFTITGGMGKECLMYHSRLAQLIAIKKGKQYAKTISWIRTRTSFAVLRSALVCLRGSRERRVPRDIKNADFDIEIVEGAIQYDYWCVSIFLIVYMNFFYSKVFLSGLGTGNEQQKIESSHQNLIRIVEISALTFMLSTATFGLILYQ